MPNWTWVRRSISSVRNHGPEIRASVPSSMPIACCLPRRCSAAAFAVTPRNGGTSRCETSHFRTVTSIFRYNDASLAVFPSAGRQLQTQIKFLDQIVVVKLVGRSPLESDLAVNNDIAAVGDPDRLVEILLGHQYGKRIALLHFGNRIDGSADENRREANRWFVDQKNFWRQHERAPQRQHLLLATGKAACELTAALGEARKSFKAHREIARQLGPRRSAVCAEQEIFLYRQHRKQPAALGHQRDAEIDNLFGGATDQFVMDAVDR